MKAFLLRKESNQIIQEFDNVLKWGEDYVLYLNNGYNGKIYCDSETEYFSDVAPEQIT